MLLKLALLVVALGVPLTLGQIDSGLSNGLLSFVQFKQSFNKVYSSRAEEAFRSRVYSNRVREIQQFNAGKHSYEQGISEHSDKTDEEFKQMMGLPETESNKTRNWYYSLEIDSVRQGVSTPPTKNWQAEGKVTEVKNQGRCGSCACFAGTGAIESANWIKNGKKVVLSEQQIVDCWSPGYDTCGRGIWMEWGYDHVKDVKGQNTEECYPYEGKNGDCRIKEDCKVGTVSDWKRTKNDDERDMANAVANIGPVAIAMDVNGRGFNSYKRGVYNDPNCNKRRLGHAMLVVGYGREGSDDFWLIKNSWGATWGDRGYIKVKRGDGNKCGVCSRGVYPIP